MSVTVEDRIIYIRELVQNLTDCAMDTLAGYEVEETICEEIAEILYALSEDVDGEVAASGLLGLAPNPEIDHNPQASPLK